MKNDIGGWGLTLKKSSKTVTYGVRVPKDGLNTARQIHKDRHADLKTTATAVDLLEGAHYEVQGVPVAMNGLELEGKLSRSGWPATVRKKLHRHGGRQTWVVTATTEPRSLVLTVQGVRWAIQPMEGDLLRVGKNKKKKEVKNTPVFTLPPNAVWGRQAGPAPNPTAAPQPGVQPQPQATETQQPGQAQQSGQSTHFCKPQTTPVMQAPASAPPSATSGTASTDQFVEWARRMELENEQERKTMEARLVDMERKNASTANLLMSVQQNVQTLSEQMGVMAARLEQLDVIASAVNNLAQAVGSIQKEMQAQAKAARKTGGKRKCEDEPGNKKAASGALVPTAGIGREMTPMIMPNSTPLCAAAAGGTPVQQQLTPMVAPLAVQDIDTEFN